MTGLLLILAVLIAAKVTEWLALRGITPRRVEPPSGPRMRAAADALARLRGRT